MKNEAIDKVHRELATEIGNTFGCSYRIFREFRAATNTWEWTIFTKFIGRGVRFDLELEAKLAGHECALEILLAQLPEQMMEWTERNVSFNDPKSLGNGWFAIDRNSDEGIAGGARIIVEPSV